MSLSWFCFQPQVWFATPQRMPQSTSSAMNMTASIPATHHTTSVRMEPPSAILLFNILDTLQMVKYWSEDAPRNKTFVMTSAPVTPRVRNCLYSWFLFAKADQQVLSSAVWCTKTKMCKMDCEWPKWTKIDHGWTIGWKFTMFECN